MRKIALRVAAALAVLIALAWFSGLVGFHYPHVIKNEPLKAPVKVMRVDEQKLFLEDGRTIEVETYPGEDLTKQLSQSDFMIDVEPAADGLVNIYARQDGWICGTPWAQAIRIPIFRDKVYKNRRELIAVGRILKDVVRTEQEPYPRAGFLFATSLCATKSFIGECTCQRRNFFSCCPRHGTARRRTAAGSSMRCFRRWVC